MAKQKARSLTTIVAIIVIGFLAAFFLYMWRYDYKVQNPEEFIRISRTLRGALRVDLAGESGFTGPVGVFTIANISPTRVRLMETRQLFPLFDVKLLMKEESGPWAEAPMQQDYAWRRSSPIKSDVYDKDNDALVELISGTTGHTRLIPLQSYFVLPDKPHSYKLTVTYQPGKIAEAMGDTFNYLEVTREGLTGTVAFDWPEVKTKPVEKEAEKAPTKPPEATPPAP